MLIEITPAEAFELKAIAATRKVLRPIADKIRAAERFEGTGLYGDDAIEPKGCPTPGACSCVAR